MKSLSVKTPPLVFEGVFGLEKQKKFLANAVKLDRLAHAYLFIGPDSVGKTTYAKALARGLLCFGQGDARPCGTCISCRVKLAAHPDVVMLPGKDLGVEEVRRAKAKFALSAFGAGKKILIISEADELTPQANSALLKFLEEPSSHTLVILTTSRPNMLPATIRSRTQRIRFLKSTDQEVEAALDQSKLNHKDKAQIISLSGGLIGAAMSFAENPELLEKRLRAQSWHEKMMHENLLQRLIECEPLLKQETEELNEFLQDWLSHAASQVDRTPGSGLKNHTLRLCKGLLVARRQIDQYANKRLIISNLATSF